MLRAAFVVWIHLALTLVKWKKDGQKFWLAAIYFGFVRQNFLFLRRSVRNRFSITFVLISLPIHIYLKLRAPLLIWVGSDLWVGSSSGPSVLIQVKLVLVLSLSTLGRGPASGIAETLCAYAPFTSQSKWDSLFSFPLSISSSRFWLLS